MSIGLNPACWPMSHAVLQAALETASSLSCSTEARQIPTQQAALLLLHRLRGGALLAEALLPAVCRASSQLMAQLAHSFFMPLCLCCLALLARVRVLVSQLLLDAVRAYNAAAELTPMLPAGGQDAKHLGGADLPQALRVSWQGGLPRLEGRPYAKGASLHELSMAAAAAHGFVWPDTLQAPQPSTDERRRDSGPQIPRPPPAMLPVVEDRGVPISREAVAAAAPTAAHSAAGPSPLAAEATEPAHDKESGGPQEQLPEIQVHTQLPEANAEVERPAAAAPSALQFFWEASALPKAMTTTAALAATAPLVAAAPEQVTQQPPEHMPLYHRAARGLGTLGRRLDWRQLEPVAASTWAVSAHAAHGVSAQAAQPQPQEAQASTAAVTAPAPAAKEAVQHAYTGTQIPTSASVAQPAFMAVPASQSPLAASMLSLVTAPSAAPSPAFTEVPGTTAAPAQPAFTMVVPSAARPAAPAPRSLQPAFVGVPAPAAGQRGPEASSKGGGSDASKNQLALLALESRRKRRRPPSSVGPGKEPAAALKSWEDWLALGGSSRKQTSSSQQDICHQSRKL